MRITAVLMSILIFISGCSHFIAGSAQPSNEFVLIDPGHGGFDGGAVAKDGTQEKHINLAISLLLRDLLSVSGITTVLTRETDISLAEGSSDSIRSRKISDMKQRLILYNEASAVVSIHQNQFGSPKYRGTQVFYSSNHPNGSLLANCIQQSAKGLLQPENNREIKKANDGIYLLYHTQQPAVLVECGFLSHPEECALLKAPEYQQQIAFVLLSGYFDYLSQK